MTRNMTRSSRRLSAITIAFVVAAAAAALAADAPQPLSPQPAATTLQDGLTAKIYFSRFEHIDDLQRFIDAAPRPNETRTLPNLDYAWGAGNVLGTTSSDLVGARIDGLILLDERGTYRLMVTSNDGVRLTVGGVALFEDPDIHSDRDSPPIPIEVTTPGWYPIDILYFEKKGTATLKLAWSPPDRAAFVPVPPAAFKHQR
jgi:hypothetical protein